MIQSGRAARRLTMQAIRPRRNPATVLLVAAWAGAAAVMWLWWDNTAVVHMDTAEWLVGAGRITGLLGGYMIALVVLQMARVPGGGGPGGGRPAPPRPPPGRAGAAPPRARPPITTP
ncbi:hypothetical protein ACFWZR_19505, partial [Streptomyces sp. NPDC059017]